MSFERLQTEDRRLAMLRLLESQKDYLMNDSVMQMGLKGIGHSVSRDQIATDLAWLDEQGLVKLETVLGRVYVATLTKRGLDVATGDAVVPGVKRPRPGD